MTTLRQKLGQAFVAHKAGDLNHAAALYQAVLAEDAHHPEALHMLGVIAQQRGNAPLALKLIEASLARHRDFPEAWFNRALVLRILGRRDDALFSVQRAIELKPANAEAWNLMGGILRELNRLDDARAAHEQALKLKPDDAGYMSDYALALLAANNLSAAYRLACDAAKIDEGAAALTLANILKAAGYPQRAIPHMQRAQQEMPANADIRLNEATAHLQIGDYERGWPVWERRRDLDARYHHLPFWRGEPVDHLLIYEDQGMGDALQTARYIPQALDRARRVTVQTASPLQKLFALNFPGVTVIAGSEDVPQADKRVRLMSLPSIFGTTLDTVPAMVPYLHAQDSERGLWRDCLKDIASPRIGIAWGGNPDNLNDYKRSVPFAELGHVLQTGQGHMVSLQKGKHKENADLAAFNIFDVDTLLTDFAETAACMAELDLVITTCTSTAHLAGAMGRPVWLMLAFDPHWLWLMGRADTPWYPTMCIFRQPAPYVWAPVMADVAGELRKFLAGDTAVLRTAAHDGPTVTQNPLALHLPE